MKANVSLLTTQARQELDATVNNYGAGVYAHIAGGWEQHTQANLLPVPYTKTVSAVSAAAVKVDLYYGTNDTGSDILMSGPVPGASFTAPSINFYTANSGAWYPIGLVNFGAVITGNIVAASNGVYAFTLSSDDGSYLFIDGALVCANGGYHGYQIVTASVTLTSGNHTLVVKFFEGRRPNSGVDLVLPNGITYGTTAVTTNTYGSHTLRLGMDYNNAGVAAVKNVQIPVRIVGSAPTPSSAPIIVTQPTDIQVSAGSSATFTVVAISQLTLSYQWYFDLSPIPNATASSYTVPNAQYVNTGSYTVAVTNSGGTTTSTAANLILV